MRIVHIARNLETGGAERLVVDLAACQQTAGHEVHVLTLVAAAGSELELPPGVSAATASNAAAIIRRLRTIRPDIVHLHNTLALRRCALPCLLLGIPFVMTKHGAVFAGGWRSRFYRLPRHVACVSAVIRAKLLERHPAMANRSSTIANGIAGDAIGCPDPAMSREALGLKTTDIAGVWVGRCVPPKGLTVLIGAIQSAVADKRNPVFRIALAGDGPLKVDLEREVERLGLRETILFLGMRPDIRRLLPLFDFFVMPSLDEGLPIALLEAAAAGLPAVVTRVGAMPEIVADGETGWIVPPGNVDDLVAALRRIIDMPPAERRAMGQAAAKRIRENYSIQTCADRYYAVYGNVAGGPPRADPPAAERPCSRDPRNVAATPAM